MTTTVAIQRNLMRNNTHISTANAAATLSHAARQLENTKAVLSNRTTPMMSIRWPLLTSGMKT